MKTQKGITLIALVITIIVMLILVGVSITMAINGGLFEQAGKAASGTNAAAQQDVQLSQGMVNVENVSATDISGVVEHYQTATY